MGVDRRTAYAKGRPKEEAGLRYAEAFLKDVLGLSCTRIVGDENRVRGDLLLENGKSIEVKSQGIDPSYFLKNFIEVFEGVNEHVHLGGFQQTAALLQMSEEELAGCTLRGPDAKTETVGLLTHANCSLCVLKQACCMMYVNPVKGYVSMYASSDLFLEAAAAAKSTGFELGAGRSTQETYSVKAPYAPTTFACYWKDGHLVLDPKTVGWKTAVPSLDERIISSLAIFGVEPK